MTPAERQEILDAVEGVHAALDDFREAVFTQIESLSLRVGKIFEEVRPYPMPGADVVERAEKAAAEEPVAP